MKKATFNSKFALALTAMRGHLAKCPECRAVLKEVGTKKMCEEGVMLSFRVALLSLRLTKLHRMAYNDPSGFIYPCPDRSLHGKDYASTAEPHPNTGIQEGLF